MRCDKSAGNGKDILPVREKVAYGFSESPNVLVGIPINLANQVYNMALHLPPTYIAFVLGFFRLVDAFTDPLVGWLSDRFRSRFGRRRPFMFVGGIGMALTMPFVFTVDPSWGTTGVLLYFAVIGTILYFFNTLFNIPYQSLGLEMTPDYDERTSLTSYRTIIAQIVIFIAGWAWYITQLPIFADPETGNPDTLKGAQGLAFLAAIMILCTAFVPVFFCKERYYSKAAKTEKKGSLLSDIKVTFRNKAFLCLICLIAVWQVSTVTTVYGVSGYLLTYFFYDGDQQKAALLTGWMLTVGQVFSLLSIPVINLLSRRIGKEKSLKILSFGMLIMAIANLLIYSQDTYPWLVVISIAINGVVLSGFYLLLPSMLADVADYDEWNTGQRREGSFAAVLSWLYKFSATFTVASVGPILDIVGFDAALMGNQGDGVFFKMKMVAALIPALIFIISIAALKYYPLSREKANSIRIDLEKRRGLVSG